VKNRRFGNCAVSQVIAALLLIAITVAAAVLLYTFSVGLLGSLETIGGQQMSEQLMLEAYSWSPGVITGSFKNVGSSPIPMGQADVFVNGMTAGHPGGACAGLTLTPQQGCGFIIATTGAYAMGTMYSMKVVTPVGGVFTYAITYSGTG